MGVDYMLKSNIQADELHITCTELICEYFEKEGETADRVISEYADEIKDLIAQRSPRSILRSNNKYSKGWRVKKSTTAGKTYCIIHNKNKPRLTHILEKGTDERKTAKGWNRGKVESHPHMETAFSESMPSFIEKLKQELSK